MARRKKAGELRDDKVECGYCDAVIPEDALRCPKCGKLFSAAKKMAAFVVVVIVVLASMSALIAIYYFSGQQGYDDVPGDDDITPPTTGSKFMVIGTSYGQIKIELDTVNAPVTTAHIISLVNSGWYNGGGWYRAIPGFVLQGGTERSDKGSSSTNVAWEDTGVMNTKYTVAMARSGQASDPAASGSASSEFFVNLGANTNLDSQYAYVVFGKVVTGQNVIDTILGLPATSEYLDSMVMFTSVSITSV
ncbi:MAG: peptidylprolyl isomerase [Candidatus Thermoplasmatota archaeon]|nr:peptidylprolyl isomerase [Candidatus Thermoplasmatota archaeon]MBU4071785.1 peptidylprolyl isomerase [Candidatus Thermoplasmatota archaeon]MBU4143904.1 peptidylprolyl isomerase [Candidatus Thermoplasmatota archaeon]MBU4592487.1 peptidylprolyl isomerase [Candidatus Thermoplasmatota archaeon]